MKFLKLPENARFSNKQIFLFILPIFLEQILISAMGIVDSMMVAHSPFGAVAVAAVGNVNRIDMLTKQVLVALSAGGSVVISQYIGAKDCKRGRIALKSCFLLILAISAAAMILMYAFKENILHLLYSSVEKDVMEQSLMYFSVTILSYPLVGLYNMSSASFRAMRNSKIPMVGSFVMMSVSLILKYIFIFILDMGVIGAALSTLLGYGITAILLTLALLNKKNIVYIEKIYIPKWNYKMVKRIFNIAVPNGIENGLFQVGSIIMQILVSSLSTSAIAAHSMSQTLSHLVYALNNSFVLSIITFVGQCMGAGKPEEASMYIKHILKLNYVAMLINIFSACALAKPLVGLFGLPYEVSDITIRILYIYFFGSLMFYPTSFVLANALRGAGDTRFVMATSISSMFLFRIIVAYSFVNIFNLGVYSIWYAMVMDWVIRSTVFIIRFKQGKWKKIKVID